MKMKIISLSFTFLIICSTVCPLITANQGESNETTNDSFIKDIEITHVDFPENIQKCFSKFNVDVTIRKYGISPLFLTAVVFIRDCEKFFGKIRPIGIKSVPAYETNSVVNFSVPCRTYYDPVNNFLKKRALWNNKDVPDRFIKTGDVISDGEIGVLVFGGFKFCSERYFVTLINPLTYKNAIRLEWFNTSNETDKNGNFTVSLNISNCIDCDIRVSVLVDIADKPLFNSIFPSFLKFDTTIYNAGSLDEKISRYNYLNKTINCSFPENWYCNGKFDVTIECAPYISIDNLSTLGKTFYDERFKEEILPKYDVDSDVLKSIKRVWYNTPIFLDDSDTLFPVKHDSILFNGTSFLEEVVEKVDEKTAHYVGIIKEVAFFISIVGIIFLICLVLFRGFIDWVVRKKS